MKKVLFTLLCLCLLLSIVSCKQTHHGSDKELYDDILSQYTDLLTAKYNGEELPKLNTKGMDKRESEITKVLHGIVDACKDTEDVYNQGYGYKDMDGNGTLELILLTKFTTVNAIFTISDEKPVLLESNYGTGDVFIFAPKNRLFMMRSTENDNIQKDIFYTCRVDGDKMAYDAVYGIVKDQDQKEITERFQMVDGKRLLIDKETFDELNREYKTAIMPGYTHSKLSAPRIYLPLVKNDINKDLPVADFSSYSAIRETYKAISTCLDEFKHSDWIKGNYDNLFSFPNDVSFEYYNRLLFGVSHKDYSLGYDEIDLNDDGQEELVLMNEDYRIKAIFTQKNGIPVMVDAFDDYTCWLDDQGFIHVDRVDYSELEYTLYKFTKNGEYNLVYSILVAESGKRYYTENGKTKLITFEESLEIYYDDYCRYPEYVDPCEQTRNVSGLTYTPLTKITDDVIKAAFEKTWYKCAKMEKTSGKTGATSSTYVTFENATDTQMDVNFKYAFSFYYPDPNRDNYYLIDTTESFLKITARVEDGVFVFDESGVKGRIEIGYKYMWIIIEESTDERFPVGPHCFYEHVPVL